MKRAFVLLPLLLLIMFTFLGCATNQPAPDDLVFTEFSSSECDYQEKFEPLVRRGYRGIAIPDATLTSSKGNIICMKNLVISADDYMMHTPDLKERIEQDRIYKIYLQGYIVGNFLGGYDIIPRLIKIDGLRTVVEIEQEKKELRAALDQKGKELSENYEYHGIEESEESKNLFEIGALEVGHAYLFDSFAISENGDSGGISQVYPRDINYKFISYINQKTRAEVISTTKAGNKRKPICVVILGGGPPEHTPIILGVINQQISD